MNSYDDGTFKPGSTMTRAEACTTISRLLAGGDENVSGTTTFADVTNHWAAKYIGYCEAKGLLKSYSGNPGKVFDKIDFVTRGPMIRIGTNNGVTVDNIAFIYSSFGISAGTQKDLKVTNCTFEWIGGNMQGYHANGSPIRYGNAIEVYGGCDNYVVDNCYFNEVYDAAVTHQVGGQSNDLRMDNISYTNNVMTNCQYSIEYFFNTNVTNIVHEGENVLFANNLMRRAGYGFGSTRPNLETQRHMNLSQNKQRHIVQVLVISEYVGKNNTLS